LEIEGGERERKKGTKTRDNDINRLEKEKDVEFLSL
jgi:hypothetical protein